MCFLCGVFTNIELRGGNTRMVCIYRPRVTTVLTIAMVIRHLLRNGYWRHCGERLIICLFCRFIL